MGQLESWRKKMRILGIGTDIMECARIGKMIEEHGELFLQRVFTPAEIRYCQRHRASTERYTGRWAAKEAILKAIGTGWSKGISWLDVEVRNEPSGRPIVALAGVAREFAVQAGIREIQISVSHARTFATATAIAVGHGEGELPEEIPWASVPDARD